MSTFAWFDISTINNIGILDAERNDVLIRCLEPSQKFIFGTTNKQSSLILDTYGKALLKKELVTPLVTVDKIKSINNHVQIEDGVFIKGSNITSSSINTDELYIKQIILNENGWIKGGDFLQTNVYLDSPNLFTDTISKNSADIDKISFRDNVQFTCNVNFERIINCIEIYSDGNIVSKCNLYCNNISCKNIETGKIHNSSQDIEIQGVLFKDVSSISCSNLKSTSIQASNLHVVDNVVTAKLEADNILTKSVSSSFDSITIQGITITNSNIYCENQTINKNAKILGNVNIDKVLSVVGNAIIYENITCSKTGTFNSTYSFDISTCNLVVNNISSPTGNININNGGFVISSFSNLQTSNIKCETFCNNSIYTDYIKTNTLQVNKDVTILNNLNITGITSCSNIKSYNLSVSNINNIFFEKSNINIPGIATASNMIIEASCKINSNCDLNIYCDTKQHGVLNVFNNFNCIKAVKAGSLNTKFIISPNEELYIDEVLIKNKNRIFTDHVYTNTIDIAKEALIGKLDVSSSAVISSNLECKEIIFCDHIKSHGSNGYMKIENVVINDYNNLLVDNIKARNINLRNGVLLFEENTALIKNDSHIIIDEFGKINGTCILKSSVLSESLKNQCITSSKLDSRCILSSHLSYNLKFEGTSSFENINVNGNFNTYNNQINICGVAFSNGYLSIGDSNNFEFPLNVSGKVKFKDENVFHTKFGYFNDKCLLNIESTRPDTPVEIQMSYNSIYGSSFQLVTYPIIKNNVNYEEGDLIINTTTYNNEYSKIFINDSCVITNSNIGIWKKSPQAPLHTTTMATDTIGIGGITNPVEAFDMKGNAILRAEEYSDFVQIQMFCGDNNETIISQNSDSSFKIFNTSGDVVINAYDIDPSFYTHLRVQKLTGHIGMGTENPLAPLHIVNYLRPGYEKPQETLIIESDSPSIKMSNKELFVTQAINEKGQYTIKQKGNTPSMRFVSSNRKFTKSGNIIIGADDNIIELGPYTSLTMFTEDNFFGMHETIQNDSAYYVDVSITNPFRVTNWATEIHSIVLNSTNSILHSISADILYTSYSDNTENKYIFTISKEHKAIGLGTKTPKAAIDIQSNFSYNVISYMNKCILDTDYNIKNVKGLYIKGPFYINGLLLFDDQNNLQGVNNIKFESSLIKSGKTIIDTNYNLENINSFSLNGPIIYNGNTLIDIDNNIYDLKSVYYTNSIICNDVEFVDSNRNVKCVSLLSDDSVVVKVGGVIGIENVGYLTSVNNYLNISPLNTVRFTNLSNNNEVMYINTLEYTIGYFGSLVANGFKIITDTNDVQNINKISVFGPIVVNNSEVLTSDLNLYVNNIYFQNQLIHNNNVVIDTNRNIRNIFSIYCNESIFMNNKILSDIDRNITAKQVRLESIILKDDISFTSDNEKSLVIESPNVKLDIENKVSIVSSNNISLISKSVDILSECTVAKVITSDIYSDNGVNVHTGIDNYLSTNNGIITPLVKFMYSDFNIHVNNTNCFVLQNSSLSILEIRPDSTKLNNNVIIGNPKEINHGLSVGGTIYSDNDIFSFSDSRLKSNIKVISSPLQKLKKLKGVTFYRTDDKVQRRYTGLIAQDVLKVIPEAVYVDKTTGYMSVAYGNLIGLVIESIKQINKQISKKRKITVSRRGYSRI